MNANTDNHVYKERSYPESSAADPGPNLDPDLLVRRMDPEPDP